MKRNVLFLLFLFILSGISGYLLSKASLAGRVGISLFYKEYSFLKVWWQGGLLFFCCWLLLFFLQGAAERKLAATTAKTIQIVTIVAALTGMYLTYQDFRHTTSHRWLGERFHLGGYLFWIGWISISVFYLTREKKQRLPAAQPADSSLPVAEK